MKKNLLYIISLFLLFGCKPDPQSIFVIDGDLWDYDWANGKNEIAILMEEADKTLIYVIDVELGVILQTIDMSSHESVGNISWTHDDQGIMFLTPDPEGYSSTTLKFPIFDHQNIDTVGLLGAYNQTHIIDENPNYMAVLSSGEGHPDITVYAKDNYEEELFSTDVYPGGIGIIDWLGDTLLVESDMKLEYGLNRADREDYVRENNLLAGDSTYEALDELLGPMESFATYKLIPSTQEALQTDIDPFAWEPISFDQTYQVKTEKKADGTHQTSFQFVELK